MRASCPKDKLKFKFFSQSSGYICTVSLMEMAAIRCPSEKWFTYRESKKMPTAFRGPNLVVCDREVPGVLNMLKIYIGLSGKREFRPSDGV